MVCMCVGARGVRPKTRAQVVRESIVEHQEESVAHNHEPRRSGRIHARGDIAHPSIVLAKWLPSEFMVVKPSEACIVSMLKRACKASGGHAMVRVLDGGMMIWCVKMHPRLIFTLIPIPRTLCSAALYTGVTL